jgi:hypothetical protein
MGVVPNDRVSTEGGQLHHFDPESLDLGPFRFFGKAPGEALWPLWHFKNAARSTPNADGDKPARPKIAHVGQKYFDSVNTLDELIVKLFG